MKSSTRPLTVSRPAVALLAVCGALFIVARTTGSGWLVVILTGVAAIVVVAAVLPGIALRRLRVQVHAPRDATVGRAATIRVDLSGSRSPVKLRVANPPGQWTGAEPPVEGGLTVIPTRRGVVRSVDLEIRSGAPLGLVWWRRTVHLSLEQPLEIGPRPLDADAPTPRSAGPAGSDSRRSIGAADLVRSTRDYVSGDPIKLVHWPATARYGELVVKELESPVSATVAIVVELPAGDPDFTDEVAGYAAGIALAALRDGLPMTLVTLEPTGSRVGSVGATLEVGRRLARAVPGRPVAPHLPLEATVLRVGPGLEARTERGGISA